MGSLNQYRTLSTRHDTSGVVTLNGPSNVLLVVSSGSAKGKQTPLARRFAACCNAIRGLGIVRDPAFAR
jgi:hypothetical protein